MLQRLWDHASQSRRQFFRGLMRESRENNMLEGLRMLHYRRVNYRVSVPMLIDPPGGNLVQQFAAVGRIEVSTLSTRNDNRLRIERLLRKRMPDRKRCARAHE